MSCATSIKARLYFLIICLINFDTSVNIAVWASDLLRYTGMVHKIPADLWQAISSSKATLKAWANITPLARNEWICWVISVKKLETRKRHIERVCSELKEGIRRPCCWAGCPHRSKLKWVDNWNRLVWATRVKMLDLGYEKSCYYTSCWCDGLGWVLLFKFW